MSSNQSISPLSIIAIFAGIIEASALASLPFLSEKSQTIYTWFLVGFPFFLTVLFFLTLNFNNVSLYTPGTLEASDLQPARSDTGLCTSEHSAPEGGTLTIALSGPQARTTIETHILRHLTQRPVSVRAWVLYNLDCRTCIDLSVRPLADGEEPPL